ncbi:MAG: L-threonylcarbamoyladenylate synthase [Candidatus Falkowbacteria bacterium]
MEYLKLDYKKINKKEIDLAAGYLQSGHIALLPSDTVYGLSVRADDKKVIKKLRSFKGRPDKKPLLILVSSLSMLKKYFFISSVQETYLKKIWSEKSRPTTVILLDKGLLPNDLNIAKDGLAVRLPKSDFLIKIIKCLGVPIVSTSANLNGLEPVSDLANITESLGLKKPQLIIDTGPCHKTKASRLIDLREYPQIKILRK